MKFYSKILSLLLIHLAALPTGVARDIILITHNSESEANRVKRILLSQIDLPPGIIKVRRYKSPCLTNPEPLLHICVTKNGEVKFMKVDREVLRNSFSHFLKPQSVTPITDKNS
jgi:hypothetical protein